MVVGSGRFDHLQEHKRGYCPLSELYGVRWRKDVERRPGGVTKLSGRLGDPFLGLKGNRKCM